jgi:hypothetical protein
LCSMCSGLLASEVIPLREKIEGVCAVMWKAPPIEV